MVLEHGREVNENASTDSFRVFAGLEKPGDTAHGELKPGFL